MRSFPLHILVVVVIVLTFGMGATHAFAQPVQDRPSGERLGAIRAQPAALAQRAPAVKTRASAEVAGHPLFRNYRPEDYGPDLPSQNWAIAQDRRGIIYVGNPAGVLAYDGASWRLIPTENRTLVRTVFSDSTGRVYVGAYGEVGYLAPDDGGTMRFVSLLDEVPAPQREFGHTWSGAAGGDGVYFQTRRSIFRWDGESMDVWTTSESARFYKIFSVRDTIYVARENAGLHRIVDGRMQPVPGGERFTDTSVTAVLPHGEGGLLIGTSDSNLYVRRGAIIERLRTTVDAFLQANELYTAAVLPDGSYAFATLWGGVVITDAAGDALRVLDKEAGLVDDDVKALFVDRQDGLWIAYESGLARVEVMLPISVFDDRTGLDGVALSIARHRGRIYVGTSSGLFRLGRSRLSDGTVRPTFERVMRLRAQVFSLLPRRSGLLVATDRGVYRVREARREAPVETVVAGRTAYALAASRSDSSLVYAGYLDGIGTVREENGQWVQGAGVPDLDRGIFFLQEDDRGDLWAASAYGGLWNVSTSDGLRNQPTVTEIAAEGQRPQHVFRMAYVSDNGLYVVAREGIARPYRDETGSVVLTPDTTISAALPSNAGRVLNLNAAPDGDLWVTTEHETYRLTPPDASRPGGAAVLVENAASTGASFSVSVPFAYVPEFNAYGSCAEVGGRFWVVGEEGVVHHRPRAYPRRPYEAQTFIRTVELIRRDSLIFGGTDVGESASLPNGIPPTANAAGPSASRADREGGARTRRTRVRGIEMPYEDNAIRLEFAAPVFGREENVEYQYRLVGFDAAWSTWSTETRKEYTNLPPGHYEFTVRARNVRLWTAGTASYPFSVMPPWYRTVWAYGAYALLMGGLVFGVVQWRSAQLERRAERLESVVARRTAEVQEQARQLEVYNSELVRSNEVLQETVEEKSKLLGVAAHDLKNPLFGIRALSEVLLERGEFDDRTRRKLNLIRESADETLRLINDLLASAAASAQAQAHVEMIDAGALAEWVAHSFAPQADRKGQHLACEVPPTPCIVEADKRKLREAMNNLISNAIKYSPHGASIDVSVERSGETVRFRVADEGPGLSEEDQQRLFAPFQRLTPEPTGDEGSSGLGLYIVKQVAELHGGDVDVESAVGVGSTFTLVIPLATGTTGAGRWG